MNVALLAKRLVVVLLVVDALFATRVPLTVVSVVVKLVIVPVDDVSVVIVPDVAVRVLIPAVFAVRSVIVVVARVELPKTNKFPVVVELPNASTKELRFSVQSKPFQ